jgi:predicted nuclease of predicted toxin-antitoxin system
LRFLVDVQLPPALARWLRQRGHEADHVREIGLDAFPDRMIAAEAVKRGAAIITKDSDFT